MLCAQFFDLPPDRSTLVSLKKEFTATSSFFLFSFVRRLSSQLQQLQLWVQKVIQGRILFLAAEDEELEKQHLHKVFVLYNPIFTRLMPCFCLQPAGHLRHAEDHPRCLVRWLVLCPAHRDRKSGVEAVAAIRAAGTSSASRQRLFVSAATRKRTRPRGRRAAKVHHRCHSHFAPPPCKRTSRDSDAYYDTALPPDLHCTHP